MPSTTESSSLSLADPKAAPASDAPQGYAAPLESQWEDLELQPTNSTSAADDQMPGSRLDACATGGVPWQQLGPALEAFPLPREQRPTAASATTMNDHGPLSAAGASALLLSPPETSLTASLHVTSVALHLEASRRLHKRPIRRSYAHSVSAAIENPLERGSAVPRKVSEMRASYRRAVARRSLQRKGSLRSSSHSARTSSPLEAEFEVCCGFA
jgi:hypothetical protein